MICYWCHWGWPKPIRDIYGQALAKLGGDDHWLHYGPGHIVWADENWDSAQWCLDHFDEYVRDMTEHEKAVVRESLELLLAVPDEYKSEPDDYDEENPQNFPPPAHWQCKPR